jgi:hypothetical protein
MKNSVAIWSDSPPHKSDLHINYWITKNRMIFRDHFLDFGLKLLNWDGGEIKFYIPIKDIGNNLLEIGSELKERELANALFNENCQIAVDNAKRFKIGLPDEELTVFVFDVGNDVHSEQKYGGTLFSINVPSERKNWYIRFRIRIQYPQAIIGLFKGHSWKTIRSSFSKKFTPSGSFYQSVRTSVEAVDFRINDKRDLNVSLLDENQAKFLDLRKLHFFLIYDNDEEFVFSTTKPKKVRLLESNVWNRYLQSVSADNKKYCATHWSCTPPVEEGWEIFVKIKFASANILTMAWYMILIMFLAFIINLSSAFTYDKLKEMGLIKNMNTIQSKTAASKNDKPIKNEPKNDKESPPLIHDELEGGRSVR